jgi:hypothetical protein
MMAHAALRGSEESGLYILPDSVLHSDPDRSRDAIVRHQVLLAEMPFNELRRLCRGASFVGLLPQCIAGSSIVSAASDSKARHGLICSWRCPA